MLIIYLKLGLWTKDLRSGHLPGIDYKLNVADDLSEKKENELIKENT